LAIVAGKGARDGAGTGFGEKSQGLSCALWFVLQKSGERDSVCREMGRREKTPKAEKGSLVFQREGRPTWFQRVAASEKMVF